MTIRMAFAGLRHGHITALHQAAREHGNIDIVACAEDDQATRESFADNNDIDITHSSCLEMMEKVDCDVIAIGDCYGLRGKLAIAALEHGRHVIADKPICTSLEELDIIEEKAKSSGKLVTAMLDLRDSPPFLGMYAAMQAGEIGRLRAASFGGQHPLMFGTRPGWYFEKGLHGGTINDIAIHAFDLIPWLADQPITGITAARTWHTAPEDVPWFNDAGQVMFTLENGAGIMGDVSYFTPNSFGYSLPHYWRVTLWGEEGVLETHATAGSVSLWKEGEKEMRSLPLPEGGKAGYLKRFLAEIGGEEYDGQGVTSAATLAASRWTLKAQEMADRAG